MAASDPGLWVQIGSEKRRLTLADIRWVEAEHDYVRVHMNGQAHLVNALLGDMEKALDEHAFLRVHRSAIVRRTRFAACCVAASPLACSSSTTATSSPSGANTGTWCGRPLLFLSSIWRQQQLVSRPKLGADLYFLPHAT